MSQSASEIVSKCSIFKKCKKYWKNNPAKRTQIARKSTQIPAKVRKSQFLYCCILEIGQKLASMDYQAKDSEHFRKCSLWCLQNWPLSGYSWMHVAWWLGAAGVVWSVWRRAIVIYVYLVAHRHTGVNTAVCILVNFWPWYIDHSGATRIHEWPRPHCFGCRHHGQGLWFGNVGSTQNNLFPHYTYILPSF